MAVGLHPARSNTNPDHRSRTHVPAILDKILRIGEGKILRQLEAISRAVNAIEEDFVAMSDEELQGQTAEFKRRLAEGETLAELKTGEGKTLVSTLPAYLNALSGDGVHVVTVNDYLAKYHAEWMGRVHQ